MMTQNREKQKITFEKQPANGWLYFVLINVGYAFKAAVGDVVLEPRFRENKHTIVLHLTLGGRAAPLIQF